MGEGRASMGAIVRLQSCAQVFRKLERTHLSNQKEQNGLGFATTFCKVTRALLSPSGIFFALAMVDFAAASGYARTQSQTSVMPWFVASQRVTLWPSQASRSCQYSIRRRCWGYLLGLPPTAEQHRFPQASLDGSHRGILSGTS